MRIEQDVNRDTLKEILAHANSTVKPKFVDGESAAF